MKKRHGFVSNSSSSSFLCVICNRMESGMDAGLEDFDMIECKNGHVICRSHMEPIWESLADNTSSTLSGLGFYEDSNLHLLKCLLWSEYNPKDNQYVSADLKIKVSQSDFYILSLSDLTTKYANIIDDFNNGDFDRHDLIYNFPTCACPICSMSNIEDADKITFLLFSMGMTTTTLNETLRKEFSDYDELQKKLKMMRTKTNL